MKSVHLGVKYKCKFCEYESSHQSSVYRHEKSKHLEVGLIKERVKCQSCGFSAQKKETLKKHVKAFHLNETYKCDKCEYVAKYENTLRNHVKYKTNMLG